MGDINRSDVVFHSGDKVIAIVPYNAPDYFLSGRIGTIQEGDCGTGRYGVLWDSKLHDADDGFAVVTERYLHKYKESCNEHRVLNVYHEILLKQERQIYKLLAGRGH